MHRKTLVSILLIYLFIPFFIINLLVTIEPQFVYLANSFIKGHIYINLSEYNELTAGDLTPYRGHFFYPNGPVPSVLLIPFVIIFGQLAQQGFLQVPINILNFLLLYKISMLLGLDRKRSLIFTIFFIFGSVYTPVGAIPVAGHFAQVIATSILLLAIYEFLTRKRYFIIAILLALGTLTRFTLLFAALFFLIHLAKVKNAKKQALNFLMPLLIGIILIFAYNYARFDDILENGYKNQLVPRALKERRTSGLFSLKYVPDNAYHMLLKPPELITWYSTSRPKFPFLRYSDWGLSIFMLSPVLFLIYRANFKSLLSRASLLTICLISIPILVYYGNGYRQVGFRYALDFYPFLLLIMASAFKKTSIKVLNTLVSLGILITWFFIFEKLSGY